MKYYEIADRKYYMLFHSGICFFLSYTNAQVLIDGVFLP